MLVEQLNVTLTTRGALSHCAHLLHATLPVIQVAFKINFKTHQEKYIYNGQFNQLEFGFLYSLASACIVNIIVPPENPLSVLTDICN